MGKEKEFEMYELKFWFEHGGTCLWSKNEAARETYGYAIDLAALPISETLAKKLAQLEEEYHGFLDWSDPRKTQWDSAQKLDFLYRANAAYQEIQIELRQTHRIENHAEASLYFDVN